MTQTAPGWYDDGTGTGTQRWWDGNGWTQHVVSSSPPSAPRGKTPRWVIVVAVIAVLLIVGGIARAFGAGSEPRSLPTTEPASEPAAAPTSAPPAGTPTPTPIAAAGLSGSVAQAACDSEGDRQFPYGWNPHWIVGKLGESDQRFH